MSESTTPDTPRDREIEDRLLYMAERIALSYERQEPQLDGWEQWLRDAAKRLTTLRARLATAEGALRPFAKLGIYATWADDETLGLVTIRVGDIRRARAALAPIQPAPAADYADEWGKLPKASDLPPEIQAQMERDREAADVTGQPERPAFTRYPQPERCLVHGEDCDTSRSNCRPGREQPERDGGEGLLSVVHKAEIRTAAGNGLSAQIAKLRLDNSALDIENRRLRTALAEKTAECEGWEQSCKTRSQELNSLGEYLATVEEQRESLRAELTRLQAAATPEAGVLLSEIERRQRQAEAYDDAYKLAYSQNEAMSARIATLERDLAEARERLQRLGLDASGVE